MKDFRDAHPTYKSLDDDGCHRLAAAILLQTAADYYEDFVLYNKKRDKKAKMQAVTDSMDIHEFAHGKLYANLTDIPPEKFLDTVQYWYRHGVDMKRFIARWRNYMLDFSEEPSKVYYDPDMLKMLIYKGDECT